MTETKQAHTNPFGLIIVVGLVALFVGYQYGTSAGAREERESEDRRRHDSFMEACIASNDPVSADLNQALSDMTNKSMEEMMKEIKQDEEERAGCELAWKHGRR